MPFGICCPFLLTVIESLIYSQQQMECESLAADLC